MASSPASEAFAVRSVNRHFLDILILAQWSTHSYQGKTIRPARSNVSSHAKVCKNCKRATAGRRFGTLRTGRGAC